MMSDFLVRVLRIVGGYETNHIMNITDIDDKIIKKSNCATYDELISFTDHYTRLFLEDMKKMNIREYNEEKQNIHRVTDTMDHIHEMIQTLIEKGDAYIVSDGSVYYDTRNKVVCPFEASIQNNDETHSTRSIIKSEGVRSNRDFVLWKVKEHEKLKFECPYTMEGRPGWHIECSAISRKHLERVDIHIGGIDLKFPHHSCEILQSESYDPEHEFGKLWVHIEFLNFAGDKMSKSIGNILYIDDIISNNNDPFLVRMYLLSKHYRHQFDYSEKEMRLFKKNFYSIHLFVNKLSYKFYVRRDKKNEIGDNKTNNEIGDNKTNNEIDLIRQIHSYLCDDLNTSSCFQALVSFVDRYNNCFLSDEMSQNILQQIEEIDEIFGIINPRLRHVDQDTIQKMYLREEYRIQKKYALSDEIRREIQQKYIVEDNSLYGFSLIPI
jgi:cysteinyl-tRNA synthetase